MLTLISFELVCGTVLDRKLSNDCLLSGGGCDVVANTAVSCIPNSSENNSMWPDKLLTLSLLPCLKKFLPLESTSIFSSVTGLGTGLVDDINFEEISSGSVSCEGVREEDMGDTISIREEIPIGRLEDKDISNCCVLESVIVSLLRISWVNEDWVSEFAMMSDDVTDDVIGGNGTRWRLLMSRGRLVRLQVVSPEEVVAIGGRGTRERVETSLGVVIASGDLSHDCSSPPSTLMTWFEQDVESTRPSPEPVTLVSETGSPFWIDEDNNGIWSLTGANNFIRISCISVTDNWEHCLDHCFKYGWVGTLEWTYK